MKVCEYCGCDVKDDATTCPQCASTHFKKRCPRCGALLDGSYCADCARAAIEAREQAERQHLEDEAEDRANEGLAWKTVLTVFLPFVGGFFLIREHVKPGFRLFGIVWCSLLSLIMGWSGESPAATNVAASLMCLAPFAYYVYTMRGKILEKDSIDGKLLLAGFTIVLAVSLVGDVFGTSAAAAEKAVADTGAAAATASANAADADTFAVDSTPSIASPAFRAQAAAFPLVSCSRASFQEADASGQSADGTAQDAMPNGATASARDAGFDPTSIQPYAGEPSVTVNGNKPFFSDGDRARESFEAYGELDALGRCTQAFALVGPETMPDTTRGSIGSIRPSGWKIAKYDWIEGRYLFNRCHLIAFALTGENDNPLNLITGTRCMNAQGMLPFEERTASYIDRTGNHVLYRVTPVFEGENLVASGVLMEAQSIEDRGWGISFCVWCYNVEPGVVIDYATGDSREGDPQTETFATPVNGEGGEVDETAASNENDTDAEGAESAEGQAESQPAAEPRAKEQAQPTGEARGETQHYVLNTSSHRFHLPGCPAIENMKEKNKQEYDGTRDELIARGYTPCGWCNS